MMMVEVSNNSKTMIGRPQKDEAEMSIEEASHAEQTDIEIASPCVSVVSVETPTSTQTTYTSPQDEATVDTTEITPLLDLYDFEETCRLVARLGVAAMRYGLTSQGVEIWMKSLMCEFGYDGQFVATLHEIFCTFYREKEDIHASQTAIVACQDGINLHKLALLSELAVDVKKKSLCPLEAGTRLKEIDSDLTPWTKMQKTASFFMLGAGIAAIFGGSWFDILFSSICGLLTFSLTQVFGMLNQSLHHWLPLVASFSCATLAFIVQSVLPQLNATNVTLSGVWYFLPGYGVSLGTAELVAGKKILSGVSRLMQAIVTLLWLLTGSSLGKKMVEAIVPNQSEDVIPNPISKGWLVLFTPALFVSVSVVLNNSQRDTPWTVLCMLVALLTSTVGGVLREPNLGVFLGSTIMTIYANIWSNRMQRPNTLVLVPAYLMQASGSIGYLGLLRMVEGHTSIGAENVLQMFMIALLITAGIFAGNTLVPSYQL